MYSVKVQAYFSSAHNLRGYKGKCEQLHGHNWKIEVVASKDSLDKTGMVLDFSYLKNKINKLLEKLDHKYLNRITYFKKVNPTSENIAKFIYDRLKDQTVAVESVTVWESNSSCATYRE